MIIFLFIILITIGLSLWFWLASRISQVSNTGALLGMFFIVPAFYWTYKLWNNRRANLQIPVGQVIGFSLGMPRQVLGTPQDVLVHCRGRVVRCFASQTEYHTAATIDEYKFGEQ